ncbi:hypothetical protein SDC9_143054 [bioreactor metagenome]|uniref:Uncharacterized protein n=1 Tax=bioreactor metagenome TaxID=1076179 RepID=A0A645E3C6_9ZZZZ
MLPCVGAQSAVHLVPGSGQIGAAGTLEDAAPSDGAAHDPIRRDIARDGRLGQPVLTGDNDGPVMTVLQHLRNCHAVGGLLCQVNKQIEGARHGVGIAGPDRYGFLQRAGDMRSGGVERVNMLLVRVYQGNVVTGLGQKRAQGRAQRACPRQSDPFDHYESPLLMNWQDGAGCPGLGRRVACHF